MRKTKQQREVKRIVEYLISGGAYFWAGYMMFFVCDKVLHLDLWWAKLIANSFGWMVNYVLQRYWVFNNPKLRQHQTDVTYRYIVITLVDFVLDYIIIRLLKSVGVSPYLGQFISSGFFTIWNYLWYKFWVFPQKFTKKRSPASLTPARLAAHRAYGHSAYHRMVK